MVETNPFSAKDAQLGELHQLGKPLQVFRLTQQRVPALKRLNAFIGIVGIVGLVVAISLAFKNWPQFQAGNYLFYFSSIIWPGIAGLVAPFWGFVTGPIGVQYLEMTHITVCEYGLLEVTRKVRKDSIIAVRWQDITRVRRALTDEDFAYMVHYGHGQSLTLNSGYVHVNELASLIEQRCPQTKQVIPETNPAPQPTSTEL